MTATLDDSNVFLFADGDTGHVCNLGSAPDVGDLDVLCIVSNTVVDSLAAQGFLIASDNQDVGNMGMYLWRRIAVGGEASTVTVGTVGDHNTYVGWTRWKNVIAADDAAKAIAGSAGTSSPALTSGTLSDTDELVVAFGALHSIGAGNQNTPVWGGSFTGLLAGTQGTAGTGVVGYVGYRTDAGTAAVSPSVSWSGAAADDRGMMLLTFTTSDAPTATGTLDLTAPAPTLSINATASSTAVLSVTGPPATLSIDASSSSSGVLGVTGPPAQISINATVEEPPAEASLLLTAPSPTLELSTFGNPIYEQMIAAHPYIGPLLVQALSCICEQTALIPHAPQHCCFRVGTEIIHDLGFSVDQCCEGVAYVALGDLFPSANSFPEADIVRQANSNCAPPAWGLYIKLGIIRCIPVGGMDPLDCNGWNNAALQNIYDAKALMNTACCIRDWVTKEEPRFTGMSVIIDRQTQGNPLGGCIERSMTMAIQIPNCECG